MLLWILLSAFTFSTIAMDTQPVESNKKGLDIDLNLPARVEDDELDAKEQKRKRRNLTQAKYDAKRRARMKVDHDFATARRESLYKSNLKWKTKFKMNLTEEKKQEIKEQTIIRNRQAHLRRMLKFNGYGSKREEEIAIIRKAIRDGKQVTPQDRQRAIDFREKKNKSSKLSKAKAKSRKSEKQDKPT